MIALGVVLVLGLVLAIGLFCFNYTRILGGSQEHHNAIEAASLAAAKALARVVIEDPNYGFISLSDYPPIGLDTFAGDGEPMPVLGINTIIATARLDVLVADLMGDQTMRDLSDRDVKNAKAAASALREHLASVSEKGGLGKDYDGEPVSAYDDALAAYKANSARETGGTAIESTFKLTLGFLEGGSNTLTPIPQPEDMAQVGGDQQKDGKYRAFVNVPAGGYDFYFAGLGDSATLVDASRFRDSDGVRIPSIVRAEAQYAIADTAGGQSKQPTTHVVKSVACAQPGGSTEKPPAGAISVSFPSGHVPGIGTPGDLIDNPQLSINPGAIFSPVEGDWPGEGVLEPSSYLEDPSVAQIWGAGFYNWVKNGRWKPNLKSLKNMQNVRFADLGEEGDILKITSSTIFPPAYAEDSAPSPKTQTGLLSTPVGTQSDPREKALQDGNVKTAELERAFWGVSGFNSIGAQLPANTFLISFDDAGKTFTADGSMPLSKETIHEFWTALMETNTAGLATVALANEVNTLARQKIEMLTAQITEMKKSIDSAQEQLRTDTTLTPEQYEALRQNVTAWTNQLPELEAQLTSNQQFLEAGTAAYKNGSAAASVTDTMARNQRALSAKGLSKDGNTFKFGGNIFTPHRTPAASLDAIRNKQAPTGGGSDWTSPSALTIYEMPALASAHPRARPDFLPSARAGSVVPKGLSKMYLFELNKRGDVVATVLQMQPFTDVKVSDRQLFAISYKAMTTGSDFPVTWSATLRCNTVRQGRQGGGKHGGETIMGSEIGWCTDSKYRKEPKDADDRGGGSRRGGSKGGSKSGSKGGDRGMAPIGPGAAMANQPQGGPPGQQRKVRANYTCPGLATDFQLRSPLSGTGSGDSLLMNAPRMTDLHNARAGGSTVVTIDGKSYSVPGTSGLSVKPQPGKVPPGCTIGPGGSEATDLLPPAPPDLL